MDFTIKTYYILLKTLSNQGFLFKSFYDYLQLGADRYIVLRHDADKLPQNSLKFARIQASEGIKGTYYFRAVPESWDEEIIKGIADLGHEIGYHYEDVSLVAGRRRAQGAGHRAIRKENNTEKELVDIALESFSENLEKLRKIAPVKTICMHGSPTSKWDSRLLWKYYDYRDFGLIGEPYFDIDFDKELYLTDTGRRWDGNEVSVRDKAQSAERKTKGENPFADWKVKPIKYRAKPLTEQEITQGKLFSPINILLAPFKGGPQNPEPSIQHLAPFPKFHSTFDIMKAAESGQLPDQIMMTFHPQRWTDEPLAWVEELVWQDVKNIAKYFLIKFRKD
jgi:hypothetical protein